MTKWRPEGWKNPWAVDGWDCEFPDAGKMAHKAYEAGADAMLEILARAIFKEIESFAVTTPFHEGEPDTMYFQLSTEEWKVLKDKYLKEAK